MFAYCDNNPVNGYDPTGEFSWITGLIGAAVGLVVSVVSAAVTGGDATDIIISGLSSATAGFIIGSTGSQTAARAAGAAVVAAGTYIDARINGVSRSAAAGCAVLSGSISFATSSLSSALGAEQTFASAVVDSTFGLGGSLCSSAVLSAKIKKSQKMTAKTPKQRGEMITIAYSPY